MGYAPIDPWGHPYQYLSFSGLKGKGEMRKDKNLVPINSDYDLYSMGPDGESQTPLTAKASRDDIIRANNGGYVGIAENY
jgi:general secretion pathway protein G